MTLQVLRLFTRKKLVITFSFIFLTLFLVPLGISRVKPYYSGEVVSYNDKIFIGTTNTGSFELFSFRIFFLRSAPIRPARVSFALSMFKSKYPPSPMGRWQTINVHSRFIL